MPRILNKHSALTSLALVAVTVLCLYGRHASNAAVADDEVQVVITTYRDGKVYETTSTVPRPTVSDVSIAPESAGRNVAAAVGDIVVSQIYSNGGNPGSTYQNNYLELFNRTDNAIDFDGWRIYMTSANGTFDQAIAFVDSRQIFIGGHKYLLIRFGPDSANGAPVPADLAGPTTAPSPPPGVPPMPLINLSPSGKVFLTMPNVNAFGNTCPPNSNIIDFVGYGSASCFEGSGPTGTTSSSTAALRKGSGCTDSDNNAGDFDVGAPSPRNSSSPQNFCGTPPAAVIQFSQASFSDPENSGSLGFLVTRTVNTTGASSVDYATSDSSGANNCNVISGEASSRCDYIASIGTLQFAAGETFKLINVPIIDDSYAEGTETFTITLSNPTGAVLGTPSATTIVLNDNENTNGVNPIDETGFFVRQQYIDFLNREPDNEGNNYWIGEINNCTPKPQCTEVKRINVSAAFFLSIEFQESGYLAERAYKTAYGDGTGIAYVNDVPTQIPVPIIRLNEFLYDAHAIGNGVIVLNPNWQQVLEANKVAYFNAFVLRSRFLNDYPQGMPAADFVNKLNMRAGNVLTQSEKDTLISELNGGQKTRAQVFRAIAENGTLKVNETNRAFVLMQYFGYLRRNPDDPQDINYMGYKFWLDKLEQFHGNYIEAEMVKAFITSTEYRKRFGP